MRLMRSLPLCAMASALLCGTAAMAQQFAPRARIVERIDESRLVTLMGNTHPAANARNDLGRVSPGLPMTDMILVLSRSPEQQAAFDKFVAGQYDPNSPDFHQWLTPEQVGENFGPSQTDIATVTNWLTGHGFSVDEVAKNRLSIRFSGRAAQVESAFHTEMHNLSVKGEAHIGNMSDPQIPAALSPAVMGVKALHNFFPRPAHHMGSTVQRDAASGKWQRIAPAATVSAGSGLSAASAAGLAPKTEATARPQFGINVTGQYPYLVEDVGPWDFATIYNILPLWNASTPIDGTGQTIAIAGTSDIDVGQTGETGANGNNDIATFRNFFGLPTGNPANTPIRVSGNSQPLTVCASTNTVQCSIGDLIENSLDVEWSGSVAKNAQIVLVASYPASASDDSLYDSESYIVNNVSSPSSPVYGVHIMNVSYGECEQANGTAGNVMYYDLWQQAAAEGIAVFVAAGDSGSASCDNGAFVAEYGLTASGLASTPYNTAVGGTDLNWCNPDTAGLSECVASPYWNATNNATTGANVNASGPGMGYVPEVPWNETCANPLTLKLVQDSANYFYGFTTSQVANVEQACNFIYDYSYPGYRGGIVGLGTAYPYLEYFVEVVGGSGGASGCVANTTSSLITSTTIGNCISGATTTGPTTNPDTGAAQGSIALYNNGWIKPSWQAGVTGIPADGVRDLPDVSFFASDGFISSSAYLICVSQDSACSYSSKAEPVAQEVGGTSVATPAMAGVMALINQKTGAAQGFANPVLYSLAAKQGQSGYGSCSAETVTTSSSCYFNDIDEGTIAQPCDAIHASPNCTATNSTFGQADLIGILPGYSAGAGYDQASGLGSLNVANVVNAWTATVGTAAATVKVTPAQNSINSNNTLDVTVTVASSPAGGVPPTGTVTLTASGSSYSGTAALSAGSVMFTIPANSLGAPGSTFTAKYTGDAVYGPASGTAAVTVTTVVLLTPTIKVTPASTTLNSNASLNVTVAVGGTSITPTGTVKLSGGGIGTALSGTLVNGSYQFTIPANTLSSGADALTANYSGDGNYASGSNITTVTVTGSTFSMTQTPIAVSPATGIAPGASATATVTVSSTGGYTGTVTLTCQLQKTDATGGDGATCTGGGSPGVALSGGTSSGTVVFTVGTTAPVAELAYPKVRGGGWMGAGGGAVLALLIFFGIPARRRSWRQMLGVLVLMAALGCLSACGGGGGSSGSGGGGGGGGTGDPGTTKGTYTFLVQATGTPSVTPAVSTTFTVTVN